MTQRILVLEDDPGLARLFSKVLTKAGYQVDIAYSLDQTTLLIAENRYAMFLCDMHVEDGIASDFLRENWERLKSTGMHLIIISGQEQYRFLAAELDSAQFLAKPVSPHDVVNYVNQVIGQTGQP